jgi:hypothetical protein
MNMFVFGPIFLFILKKLHYSTTTNTLVKEYFYQLN